MLRDERIGCKEQKEKKRTAVAVCHFDCLGVDFVVCEGAFEVVDGARRFGTRVCLILSLWLRS